MRKLIIFLCFSLTVSLILSFDTMSSNGMPQFSGSPGESNCTNCHFGTNVNAGGGSIVITGVPITYVLSQTYTINITVSQTGVSLFGFDVEALNSSNTNAGTFLITNGAQMQLVTASNLRKNVIHRTNGGASPNSHTFTFNWIAPSTNVGVITFYATGNAANGNGNEIGDRIYSTSVTAAGPLGIADVPIDYFDLTAFPNPVKEKLYINFTLDKSTWISVDLFSLDGKKINNLLNEEEGMGKQIKQLEVPFEIPDGIYFISVSSDQKRTVRKILLER